MTYQSFDFPQDDIPNEQVPQEEEPRKKPKRTRGKPVLGKLLFFIVILGLILLGFVVVQTTLLDLEAQAQISAVQTATYKTPAVIITELSATPEPPTPTATLDANLMHTATIAAQLTLSAP